jgi:hypothetical protein
VRHPSSPPAAPPPAYTDSEIAEMNKTYTPPKADAPEQVMLDSAHPSSLAPAPAPAPPPVLLLLDLSPHHPCHRFGEPMHLQQIRRRFEAQRYGANRGEESV